MATKPENTTSTLVLSRELRARAKTYTHTKDISFGALMRAALVSYLDANEKVQHRVDSQVRSD